MTILNRTLWAWSGAAVLGLTSLAVAEAADARYRYTHLTLILLAGLVLAIVVLATGTASLWPHLRDAWLQAHGIHVSVRRDGWDPPPSAAVRRPPPVLDLAPAGAVTPPEEDPQPAAGSCRNAPPEGPETEPEGLDPETLAAARRLRSLGS